MRINQNSSTKTNYYNPKIRHKRNNPLEISFFNVTSNNFNTLKLSKQNKKSKQVQTNVTKENNLSSLEDIHLNSNSQSNIKNSKFNMKVSDYYMMFYTNPPDNIKEVRFREEFIKKKFNLLFQKTITDSDDYNYNQTLNQEDSFIIKNKLPKGTKEWIPFYPCLDKDDIEKIRQLKNIHLSNRNNLELYRLNGGNSLNINTINYENHEKEKEIKENNSDVSKIRINSIIKEIKSNSIMERPTKVRKSLLTTLANEYKKKEKIDKSILRNTIDVFNINFRLKDEKSHKKKFKLKKKKEFSPFSEIHFERKDIKQPENRKTIQLSASVIRNKFKKGIKEKENVSRDYSINNIYESINEDLVRYNNYKCNCEDCADYKSLLILKEKKKEDEIKNIKLSRIVVKENKDKNKISKNNTYTTDNLYIKSNHNQTKGLIGKMNDNFKPLMSNIIKKNTITSKNNGLTKKSNSIISNKDNDKDKGREDSFSLRHINVNSNNNTYFNTNNTCNTYNTISQSNITYENNLLNTSTNKKKSSNDFNIEKERTNLRKNMKMIRLINKNPHIINCLSNDYKLQSEIDYIKNSKFINLPSYNLQISNLFSKRLDFNNYQQLKGRLDMINKISSNKKVPISQKLILLK